MTQRDDSYTQLRIEVPRSARRSHFSEPCPKCGAPVGEQCRTASGDAAPTHRARRVLASRMEVRDVA